MSNQLPHVVIVGGGFGGLEAAKRLARKQVRVTLVDRRNHHLFQPLLYQVATGGLSAAEIAMPIRKYMRKHKNVNVWLAEVDDIDIGAKKLRFSDNQELAYDYLIVATGATHSYFGNDAWTQVAPGLKTIEDAFEIRRRVFSAFERAERIPNAAERSADLTFVVVGGGPTGVELAGSIAEIARNTLVGEFRSLDPTSTRVILAEGLDRVLPMFSAKLSASAKRQLEELGVEVRCNAKVTSITTQGVTLDGKEQIAAHTVLWAAGVKASSLGAKLGVPLERNGQVKVEPVLSIPGHPEIFVVGDLASLTTDSKRVPGVAQGAIQMGRHAAENIVASIAGKPAQPFRYNDKGSMATIGKSLAVAQIGRMEFSGRMAWAAWAFVHLISLIGFRNRVVTLVNWIWAYFTYQRSGRLIFDKQKQSAPDSPQEVPAAPANQQPVPTKLGTSLSS